MIENAGFRVWIDASWCVKKVGKEVGGRFHQDNGGVDLESNFKWLEAKHKEPFDGDEHL